PNSPLQAARRIDQNRRNDEHHPATLVVPRSWQPGGPITLASDNWSVPASHRLPELGTRNGGNAKELIEGRAACRPANRFLTGTLLVMALVDRSEARSTSHTFRMSADEKAQLKHEATDAGLSLQQLFELRMLGAAKPRLREGRPRKDAQSEELPLVKSA
ncbi:MAG: hypothetical protein ACR2LI_12445, partial [Propionibacteriaceae bacterium]